eukprot:754796-Hanusia_phi.AAC.2
MKTIGRKLFFLAAIGIAANGDIVASSDFNWDAEDWELFGPGKLKVYDRGGMLYASDQGKTVWYFAAPAKFVLCELPGCS